MAVVTATVVGTGLAVKSSADQKSAANKARRSQEQQIAENRDFVEQAQAQAREDVQRIFPQAQEARQLGFQGALDVFGQAIPQQLGAFQQGNIGAQQALLAGLPQVQRAILGQPVDLSQLQAQQINVDPSIFQRQLPALPAPPAAAPPVAPVTTPGGATTSPLDQFTTSQIMQHQRVAGGPALLRGATRGFF